MRRLIVILLGLILLTSAASAERVQYWMIRDADTHVEMSQYTLNMAEASRQWRGKDQAKVEAEIATARIGLEESRRRAKELRERMREQDLADMSIGCVLAALMLAALWWWRGPAIVRALRVADRTTIIVWSALSLLLVSWIYAPHRRGNSVGFCWLLTKEFENYHIDVPRLVVIDLCVLAVAGGALWQIRRSR